MTGEGRLFDVVGGGDITSLGISLCLIAFLHGVLVSGLAFFGVLRLLMFDKTMLKRGPSPRDELKELSSRLGCVVVLNLGGELKFGGCVLCLSLGHTSWRGMCVAAAFPC